MDVNEVIDKITGSLDETSGVDYIQLSEGIRVTSNIASILLGVMSIILIVGVSIITIIEIMYISLPVLQSAYDKGRNKAGERLGKIMGLTIRDAHQAILEANTVETGKSTMAIYLRIKVKTLFIVALVVSLLLGVGPTVIRFIISLVGKIIYGM